MSEEFNWYIELDKAIKSEPSEELYLSLRHRSSNWVTCACGQLCKYIPLRKAGGPLDLQLYHLGYQFAVDIKERYWTQALEILNLIEARTAQLLNELKP